MSSKVQHTVNVHADDDVRIKNVEVYFQNKIFLKNAMCSLPIKFIFIFVYKYIEQFDPVRQILHWNNSSHFC